LSSLRSDARQTLERLDELTQQWRVDVGHFLER
jgi:hypothetical protein